MSALYPKRIDLTLERPIRLLSALGNPQDRLPPVIHFAGTNGKGSTLAMVRAGLESAGLKVHAYISPHLTQFRERITLSGSLIDESDLSDALLECENANRGEPITLFEISTCAALLAFSRVEADVLLLEVGLGGRLDATNVIDKPEFTVISPVSLDHQQYLGETLREIAGEKAGILKRGVPCAVARQDPAALETILETAARVGAPLAVHGTDWFVNGKGGQLRYRDRDEEIILPLPNLAGPHQADNAGTAITVLRKLGFGQKAIEAALTNARWLGRMQRLRKGPLVKAARESEVWLDGGHNAAAGAALAEALKGMPARTTQIICGMLETKDARSFLRSLRTAADKLYGVSIPGETASLPATSIAHAASEVGFAAQPSSNAENAVRRIAAEQADGRILVCGSLYLAGTVLQENS